MIQDRKTLEGVCSINARMEKLAPCWSTYKAEELDAHVILMCEVFDQEHGGMSERKVTFGDWIFIPGHWMLVPAIEDEPEFEEWVPDQWSIVVTMVAR